MAPTPAAPDPQGLSRDQLVKYALARVDQPFHGWCRRHHLQPADVDDAWQTLAMIMVEALSRYDPARAAGPSLPSLHKLIGVVLARCLYDLLDDRMQLAAHYQVRGDVEQLVDDSPADGTPVWGVVPHDEGPLDVVDRHEKEARLAAAVRHLTPEQRRLYELRRSGLSLSRIAREFRVSKRTVRRWARKLMGTLRVALLYRPVVDTWACVTMTYG